MNDFTDTIGNKRTVTNAPGTSKVTDSCDELNYKERKRQLASLQSLSLQEKIERTNSIITTILDTHEHPVVAWSGGKDSTVLLYLALQRRPSIDVVWVNTGVEYPECVQFIRKLTHDWKINLYVAKPEMTFWEVVNKYGYPFFGKGNSGGYWFNRVKLWKRKGRTELARTIEVAKASTECCRILKENPANRMYHQLKTDCVILGNIVAESHQRFLIWAKRGDYFYSSSERRWKVCPLSIWTDEHIWEFHKLYGLPHSSIYDKGHRRNGCWPCLMDLKFPDNHLRSLRKSHPKLWHFLLEKKGIGEIILALKLGLNKEEMGEISNQLKQKAGILIRNQPCFFDRV